MRMGDLSLQPTPPIPPEIEGYLKKLKRKTRSISGNWNKRWFFVDPRRREFGYADNKHSSTARSSIYLDDITAVVQFDDTHFQVESRTRNFFLCGESKASTACWVTSLEGYRKKLIEYEKEKITYAAATASAAAAASKAASALRTEPPIQTHVTSETRKPSSKKKTSRGSPEALSHEDRQPANESFGSSSSSSMSSTASNSSRTKRESARHDHATERALPRSEQRSPSPLAKDIERANSRGKNRSAAASPPEPTDDKRSRDRHRDRERGRERDRERKFERENEREMSSDRDRSRDKSTRAPSGRGSVMQAWVNDF